MAGTYTVVVNGEKFNVQVAEGEADIQVTPAVEAAPAAAAPAAAAPAGEGEEIKSQLPGNVWKVVANPGDSLKEGDKIMILESMKMEIDVVAPRDCVVKSINVNVNDKVVDGQIVAIIG
jgi:pyruvate carboxylase subunit B